MDVQVITQLVSTFGVGGIFLWAWLQAVKKQDEQNAKREAEVAAREARMVAALESTQRYIQEAFQATLHENTRAYQSGAAALRELAEAVKSLPCHAIRKGDIEHLVGQRDDD